MEKMALVTIGPFWYKFQNEASSKTMMDAIMNFQFETILGQKLLICGEIPLYITYINGLKLSVCLDSCRYTILCQEMLQYTHKVIMF